MDLPRLMKIFASEFFCGLDFVGITKILKILSVSEIWI